MRSLGHRIRAIYRARAVPAMMRLRLRPRPRPDLEKLGGDYGGWIVPTSLLSPSSICYCAGIGEDITFDRALIERFGCWVYAFDPTPRALKYVQNHAGDLERFHLIPVGLWSKDTTLNFYAPVDPRHVSHSLVNLCGTTWSFEAECKCLRTLMCELEHDHIDLLKMDIEGAEFEVLENMIGESIRPKIICVEFDQPSPDAKTVAMCRRLSKSGYTLLKIDAWNYTFLHHV